MRASGIRRIAVIGAGLMGHGTALEFAAHGYDIRLHDREQTQRARARDSIAEGLGRLVEIGRITSATAAATPDHITLSTDLRSTVANAELVIESAGSALPELRDALETAWAALRKPATLQDALQERQRQQLVREAEQARARLTKAAVLFADGDIDKPGYELLRDKARVDLDVAATETASRLQVVEPSVTLPPLETVLAAAEGWGAAMREGEIAAQREVLAALTRSGRAGTSWTRPVQRGGVLDTAWRRAASVHRSADDACGEPSSLRRMRYTP